MGHLPEMAHPQHAKKPMSTPKLISLPVAERIKASEPAPIKAIQPALIKASQPALIKADKPALVQSNFRHANPAAQAIDVTSEPGRVSIIPMQGPSGSKAANTIVRGEDCPVLHFYGCKGNPTKEEADVAFMGMFSDPSFYLAFTQSHLPSG